MKLDRDVNKDGKGKYALIRLRSLPEASSPDHVSAGLAFSILEKLDMIDWGTVGEKDEFFVIKLRDKYSAAALDAYADAVMEDSRKELDEAKAKDLAQYAIAIQKLCSRAGSLNPFCKQPD